MRRREFIALLSVGAVGWPLAATEQKIRLIGVLAQDLQPELLETFRDDLHTIGYDAYRQ
jgi:hypothetical protein